MKILMLETMTYGDDISLEQFNRLGEVVTYSLSSYEEAVARMKEHNPDVVIINKTNMNAECMAAAPNLKMVAEAATGYNNIDIEYAKAHGIRVANVAGYSTQSVIQHTFALAFYLVEKMRYYDDFVKSGEYAEWPCFSHFANVFHDPAEYEKRGENVWIAKDAVIAPTASINGPCIIGKGAEIRQCAFIRGNAIVGEGAVVGNSTELKNVILFNKVQVPH